jgi:hypothetical protein
MYVDEEGGEEMEHSDSDSDEDKEEGDEEDLVVVAEEEKNLWLDPASSGGQEGQEDSTLNEVSGAVLDASEATDGDEHSPPFTNLPKTPNTVDKAEGEVEGEDLEFDYELPTDVESKRKVISANTAPDLDMDEEIV